MSYIFRPKGDCRITVYGSQSEKTVAIHDGKTESISLTFSKDTCRLLESYIENLQAILTEIKSS